MTLDIPDGPPPIAADRIDLRPMRRSDSGLMTHYTADERLARMTTSIPHPLPPGTSEAFIDGTSRPDRTDRIWAIDATRSDGSELVGVIALKPMDRGQAEIAYWVGPPFWNTGLASEAVQALVDANPLGSATYFASVFQDNPASARVLVHCGFDYVGDAEAYSVARAATVPTWTYLRRL